MYTQNQAITAIKKILKNTTSINEVKKEIIKAKRDTLEEVVKKYGCTHQATDALIKSWDNSRDPVKVLVSGEQDKYFLYLKPGKKYPVDVYNQIVANQNRLFASHNIDDFYLMRGLYRNIKTGEEIFTIPTLKQRESKEWRRITHRLIRRIDDYAVVGRGNFSHPDSKYWNKEFYTQIPSFLLDRMNATLDRYKSQGIRK